MDPTPALIGSAVALVLILVGVALRGEGGRGIPGAVALGLAPVAAVLATLYASGEEVAVPPARFRDWALLAGVVAWPLGVLSSRGRWASVGALAGVLAVAVVLYAVPTESLHERDWAGKVNVWVAVLSVATMVGYGVRIAAAGTDRSMDANLATGIVALAAAPALGWTGTGVTAFLVAGVSASAGLFGLVQFARRSIRSDFAPLDLAVAAPQVVLLSGMLAIGTVYSETPRLAAAMLFGAPIAVLLPGKGLKATIVRLVLVSAIAGAAVWMCRPEPNPYAGY
ncbi:MAG: hypothetical protein AAF957_22180 [Planctomycetota bacterium]